MQGIERSRQVTLTAVIRVECDVGCEVKLNSERERGIDRPGEMPEARFKYMEAATGHNARTIKHIHD